MYEIRIEMERSYDEKRQNGGESKTMVNNQGDRLTKSVLLPENYQISRVDGFSQVQVDLSEMPYCTSDISPSIPLLHLQVQGKNNQISPPIGALEGSLPSEVLGLYAGFDAEWSPVISENGRHEMLTFSIYDSNGNSFCKDITDFTEEAGNRGKAALGVVFEQDTGIPLYFWVQYHGY